MEIMDLLMFVVIACCIYGTYLTISFTRKKVLSIVEGAGLGVFLAACTFVCCTMLVLPMDEPREYNTGDKKGAIVQKDGFVVIQMGNGKSYSILRSIHPITNWEPIEKDLPQEITSLQDCIRTISEYGVQCELKDGSHYTMSFKNILRPITNWEPVNR